jgi:hypothetical protein
MSLASSGQAAEAETELVCGDGEDAERDGVVEGVSDGRVGSRRGLRNGVVDGVAVAGSRLSRWSGGAVGCDRAGSGITARSGKGLVPVDGNLHPHRHGRGGYRNGHCHCRRCRLRLWLSLGPRRRW